MSPDGRKQGAKFLPIGVKKTRCILSTVASLSLAARPLLCRGVWKLMNERVRNKSSESSWWRENAQSPFNEFLVEVEWSL